LKNFIKKQDKIDQNIARLSPIHKGWGSQQGGAGASAPFPYPEGIKTKY
jgi:hypothetical protein